MQLLQRCCALPEALLLSGIQNIARKFIRRHAFHPHSLLPAGFKPCGAAKDNPWETISVSVASGRAGWHWNVSLKIQSMDYVSKKEFAVSVVFWKQKNLFMR